MPVRLATGAPIAHHPAVQPHVIRPGEYLSQLAARYGFDVAQVWNHPDNAELRGRRASPEVLAPGDVVYLPDPPPATTSVRDRSSNRYQGHTPTIAVSVVIELDGEPLANTPVTVEGPTPPIETRTDGQGTLRFDAPVHLDRVVARLPEHAYFVELLIGHLDPVDEASGAAGRLHNLGYLPDDYDALPEAVRARMLGSALTAFQDDEGLAVTGDLDDATIDNLTNRHGA